MKKTLWASIAALSILMLTGHTAPRRTSDVALYGRSDNGRRISHLLDSAEDLYRRRRYEDAVKVYEIVLALDKNEVAAKAGIAKANLEISKERREQEKKALYEKYGHLIPEDLIYPKWHWGPEIGHFEVRYSKPKPYVPPVRKVHKKASDAEIAEALKKAETTKAAADYFELAMRYWSRKQTDEAVNAYYKAIGLDPAVLSEDDELLLTTVAQSAENSITSGKATASDYMNSGKLLMVQGETVKSLNRLTSAAVMDKKAAKEASVIVKDLITSPAIEFLSAPSEIFGFRQAYVFDKNNHALYIKLSLNPRSGRMIVPFDLALREGSVSEVECCSKDAAMAFVLPGLGDSVRLWTVLNERKDFEPYDIRLKLKLVPESISYLDLSNYGSEDSIPDNWSFIITSEFNQSEQNTPKGDYEKSLKGVEILGYHLALSEGRGPTIELKGFTESLPRSVDVWKLMETGGEESLDSLF